MSNLRSLLAAPGETSNQYLPTGCSWYMYNICWQCAFNAVHENCCRAWVVPPTLEYCIGTFELWGGGGGGAGSCCCMGGPPGSSGAYSKKTISLIPCTCWITCQGIATDCASGNTGSRGCTTLVCGPLLNVCGTTCAGSTTFGTCMCTIGQLGANICGCCIPAGTTITAVNSMYATCSCVNGQNLCLGCIVCGTPVVGMCVWTQENMQTGGSCFANNTFICANISGTGNNSQWSINQSFQFGPMPVYGYAVTMSNVACATISNGAVYTLYYNNPWCVSNFCAEGGYGGCSCCYPACCFSYCTCSPGCTPVATASATAGTISGTTFTAGGTVTGSFGLNYTLSGTGVTAGTTILGCVNTTTWTVDRSQTVASTTISGFPPVVANAYGGDINIQGVKGCYYHICCDNACWNKHFQPFPAGLVNQCGGWTVSGTTGSGYDSAGFCTGLHPIGWAHHSAQWVPGVGGRTHYVTGGNCACGMPGMPGMIKITYR